MATIKYKGVGITAMSACVPQKIVYNKDLTDLLPEEELEKTIKSIGIEERRIADDDVFASDLAYKAAVQLMEDNAIDPNSIDVLLFVSQTSDYRIPATAPILQHRLGLSKDTACLDITLGCSGFVFALSTAFAYASMEGVNRVLLLDGETFSKIVNERDKVDWPLYGDGATATLVEKGDFEETTFILRSDGAGEDAVKIPAGMRKPITKESLDVTEREDGNWRNDLEVYMTGMDVFNFAMSVVPSTIKEVCKTTGTELSDVDYLVFHLAGIDSGKANIVCACGKAAVSGGAHAGKMVGKVAALTGGKGGGRKDSAMAGAGDASKADEAAAAFISIVEKCIG